MTVARDEPVLDSRKNKKINRLEKIYYTDISECLRLFLTQPIRERRETRNPLRSIPV